MDEEFVLVMENIQQGIRMDETICRKFIADSFEEEFGFSMDFLPSNMIGTFGTRTVRVQRVGRESSVERRRSFEVKFNGILDDWKISGISSHTVGMLRNARRIRSLCQ